MVEEEVGCDDGSAGGGGDGIRPSFLSSIYMMEMNATSPAADNVRT